MAVILRYSIEFGSFGARNAAVNVVDIYCIELVCSTYSLT